MKKVLHIIFILCLLIGIVGCAPQTNSKKNIAALLPTKYIQRWNHDAKYLRQFASESGYNIEILFADNDINIQISQIENMISKHVDTIIICPIDGYTLSGAIALAKESGINVISYDRLIMETADLSGYISFDSAAVGVAQGQFIVDELNLKDGTGPFNIELFSGDPGDNNALYYFNGAMSILQPYIDSNQLVVTSNQTQRLQCAVHGWSTEKAQARMDDLLTSTYASGEKIDAILSPNDTLALGIIAALKNTGYATTDNPLPIITGQDGSVPNLIAINNNEQSMTIFKNPKVLAKRSIELADALLSGKEFDFNDTTTFFNGVATVSTSLCEFSVITSNKIEKEFIDSEYYTREELKME